MIIVGWYERDVKNHYSAHEIVMFGHAVLFAYILRILYLDAFRQIEYHALVLCLFACNKVWTTCPFSDKFYIVDTKFFVPFYFPFNSDLLGIIYLK
jgi:hypothetical protein